MWSGTFEWSGAEWTEKVCSCVRSDSPPNLHRCGSTFLTACLTRPRRLLACTYDFSTCWGQLKQACWSAQQRALMLLAPVSESARRVLQGNHRTPDKYYKIWQYDGVSEWFAALRRHFSEPKRREGKTLGARLFRTPEWIYNLVGLTLKLNRSLWNIIPSKNRWRYCYNHI